jgi:hypothetical protein
MITPKRLVRVNLHVMALWCFIVVKAISDSETQMALEPNPFPYLSREWAEWNEDKGCTGCVKWIFFLSGTTIEIALFVTR